MTQRIPFRSACAGLVLAVSSLLMLVIPATADDGALNRGPIIERKLAGRVVDELGKPLAGVEVFLPSFISSDSPEPALTPSLRSDSDGRFEVTVASRQHFHFQIVHACPAGRVYQQQLVWHKGDGPLPEVTLVLPKAARVSGRVTDALGRPVSGATVFAYPNGRGRGCIRLSAPPPCNHPDTSQSATTDVDGRYTFEGLRPGWVRVSGPDEAEIETLNRRAPPGEELAGLDFQLKRATVPLEGRILDAEGAPVADALVSVDTALPRGGTTTDAAGVFRFPGVLVGPNNLSISHDDHGWLRREVNIQAEDGHHARLEVAMPRGTSVKGRILGPSGEVLAEASLDFGGDLMEVAPDGTFALVLPPGSHQLLAEAYTLDAALRQTLAVTGQEGPVDLELRLMPTARIRVTFKGLAPNDSGGVDLKERLPDDSLSFDEKDGAQEITGVLPGIWTLVATDAAGRRVEQRLEIPEGRAEVNVEVELPPLVPVRGRVLTAQGKPAAGANVTFARGEHELEAETDAEGRFTVWPAAGEWKVRAEKKGSSPATTSYSADAQSPGELPDLRLGRVVPLSGRIVGLPPNVVTAWIAAELETGSGPTVEVTPDQTFVFPELWPGTWTLVTEVEGREVKQTVVIDESVIDGVEVEFDAGTER